MLQINHQILENELKRNLIKPYKLIRNLFFAALTTLAGMFLGMLIHTFHRGLPYIAANVFIWSLATYNASQLGSDPSNVRQYLKNKISLKDIFIAKNLSLFILAFPIDFLLIVLACSILNDWSSFRQAMGLGISSVIICLGLGNIVSTLWVYEPLPFLSIKKDRQKLLDWGAFFTFASISATLALMIAFLAGGLIVKLIDISTTEGAIAGLIVILGWSIGCWVLCLYISNRILDGDKQKFISKLDGEVNLVNNKRLQKILKIKQQ